MGKKKTTLLVIGRWGWGRGGEKRKVKHGFQPTEEHDLG